MFYCCNFFSLVQIRIHFISIYCIKPLTFGSVIYYLCSSFSLDLKLGKKQILKPRIKALSKTSFELNFFPGDMPLLIHAWQPDLVLATVGAWQVWEDRRAREIPEEADPSALEGAFSLTVPSPVALNLVACRPQ